MKNSLIKRSTTGFTLVEILVVIVIIATLSALGFQGYRSALTSGNKAVSTENLRQLIAANLLYVSDHGTYCPTDIDGKNLTLWCGGRSSTSTPFDPQKGLLSEYLGQSRSVGICPQLQAMIGTATAFNESGAGGYGYNDTYIGNIPSDSLMPNRPANVPNPSRTLMFATTAFAVKGGVQEYPSAAPPYFVDSNWQTYTGSQPSIHFRFNGRALIGWCDGHVSEEVSSGSSNTNYYGGSNTDSKIGFCGPAENNGWWNPRN
jgi:prepilin-type N-terminal cleavage/methylation domain-containing protein/prepilin-type processing-associated H-X9-DG protein